VVGVVTDAAVVESVVAVLPGRSADPQAERASARMTTTDDSKNRE
jgi:hypothetical protein